MSQMVKDLAKRYRDVGVENYCKKCGHHAQDHELDEEEPYNAFYTRCLVKGCRCKQFESA